MQQCYLPPRLTSARERNRKGERKRERAATPEEKDENVRVHRGNGLYSGL